MSRSGWARAFLTVAMLVFGIALCATAGTEALQEQAAMRALVEAQAKAWNTGDIEGFMAGYWKSDKTEFAGAGGLLRGWQALLDRYRRTYPDRKAMGQLTFSDLEINVLSSDSAYIVGRWQLERQNDHPGGVFTLILRKFPEGWRIVHDHTSAFAARHLPSTNNAHHRNAKHAKNVLICEYRGMKARLTRRGQTGWWRIEGKLKRRLCDSRRARYNERGDIRKGSTICAS